MPAESSHWAVAFEQFMDDVEECDELRSGSVELTAIDVDGGSVELACV